MNIYVDYQYYKYLNNLKDLNENSIIFAYSNYFYHLVLLDCSFETRSDFFSLFLNTIFKNEYVLFHVICVGMFV